MEIDEVKKVGSILVGPRQTRVFCACGKPSAAIFVGFLAEHT